MDVPECLGGEGLSEHIQVRLQLERQQWRDGTTRWIYTGPGLTETELTNYGRSYHGLTE